MLAAAVAVPAVAAPSDWSQIGPGPAELARADSASIAKMPFEVGGESFPGSAFYYLEDTPEATYVLPSLDPTQAPDEEMVASLGTRIDAGPVAAAFASYGTGMNKARAMRCMTQAIYYEAASESEAGQRAVAQVVLNRVAHSAWPSSVCGVVYEGSTRSTGCQFSFTCDGSMRRKPSSGSWARAQRIASRSLSGEVFKQVGLATHYHTNWVNPYWAPSLNFIGSIGAHRFYTMRGRNGTQAAFKGRYAGIERIPTPNYSRASGAGIGAADAYVPSSGYTGFTPLPPAPAFGSGGGAGNAAPVNSRNGAGNAVPSEAESGAAKPADPYANSTILPGSGQVKQEYANSGQWIEQPKPGEVLDAAPAPDASQ